MLRAIRYHPRTVFAFLAVVDCLILLFAIYVGLIASYAEVSSFFPSITEFAPEVILFSGTLLLALFALGLYQWQYCASLADAITRILVAFLFSFLFLSLIFYLFPFLIIWRSAAFVAIPVSIAGLIGVRAAFSHLAGQRLFKKRLLVIGVGDQAAHIERLENAGKAYRFQCVAFVNIAGEELRVARRRVIHGLNSLADFVEREAIDEIVVAVRERRGCLPMGSLVDCRLAGVSVVEFQTFCERETDHIELNALQPEWFVFTGGFPGGRLQQLIKRGFDILLSLLLLLIFSPAMVITTLLIWFEGGGPIIFRQERVGYRGEPFILLKFRSMCANAEKNGVPQWSQTNDSRVTRVGSLIRATRLDELPQLLNILKGDMSLVGPRPERPYFVEQLAEKIPYYNVRHRVKPGLTGWAQLCYPYGASVDDARKKLQYDLYYIKYFSVFRDVLIIIQTLRVVIWPNKSG